MNVPRRRRLPYRAMRSPLRLVSPADPFLVVRALSDFMRRGGEL